MTSEATVPPERELTEALLSLSWPLPRTVADAQSALDRLEQVRTVLSRLEQESVGTEAWWAGQVDALCTQTGFVLEWWRPVLRDPDLDWTLNHQAHLTADLATLASAGARLLDQLEPSADRREELARGRRVGPARDWGPAAVPLPNVPGARPQPPAEVFGDAPAAAPARAGAAPGDRPEKDAAPPAPAPGSGSVSDAARSVSATGAERPRAQDVVSGRPPSADELAAPTFPPLPVGQAADASPDPLAAARHRRPSYEFDDDDADAAAPASGPAAVPPRGAPVTPGGPTGPGGPRGPHPAAAFQGPQPGTASAGYAPVGLPPGFVPPTGRPLYEDDEEEQGRVVPTGLRRHQRRLLVQSAVILAAIGGLCWWAVDSLAEGRAHPSAAGPTSHSAVPPATGAAGLTVPGTSPGPPSHSAGATGSRQPPSAPATATTTVPDATTATSVQATLLGGSGEVRQIVALVTVRTAGTGVISVTASYYSQAGSSRLAPESQTWSLSGKTAYQFSVPIASSPYCGGTFHFTLSAAGRSSSAATSPGC